MSCSKSSVAPGKLSIDAFCDSGRRVPKLVCDPISGVRRCGDVDLDVGAETLCLCDNKRENLRPLTSPPHATD